MADSTGDLLAQAQDLQRQRLLEQAQSIQTQKMTPPPMSMTDAALVKGGEGVSLGTRPIFAGLGAAAGDLSGQLERKGKPFDFGELKNAFTEGRTGAIDEQKKAQADHPYISTAANIGGSLLSAPLIPAGAGLAGAMKVGGIMGAGQAVGSAQSLPEAAMDIGGGVIGGAGGHALAGTVGRVAASPIESLAENKAFKAAGAVLKDFRSAFNKDPDKINELGRTMIENDLVKAGDTVSSIAQKSEALKRETGQQIGKVYDKVLDSLTDPASGIHPEVAMQIQAAGFHPEMQADEMKSVVSQLLQGKPGSTGAINKASQVIDELAVNGNNITPQHALELKGDIDHMINWSKKSSDLPMDQDALKIVRDYIQTRLNDQVGALDQVLQNPQSAELSRLNQMYGNVATIANVSRDRVLRESANQSFGLGDKISGGLGATLGLGVEHAMRGADHGIAPLLIGGAAIVGNKMARTFGNAAVSEGADKTAQALVNSSSYIPAIQQLLSPSPAANMSPQNGGTQIQLSNAPFKPEAPKFNRNIKPMSSLNK